MSPPQTFTISASAGPVPQLVNATVYHGDSWALQFTLQDNAAVEGGSAVAHNLTGASVAAAAQDAHSVTTTLTAQINPDPTTGEVTVARPTPDLAPGAYQFDVQITDAQTAITTWVYGTLTVVGDVAPP